MRKTITYICAKCGKEFQSDRGCATRTPKYCSRRCSSRFTLGFVPWNKGKPMWDIRPHPPGTLGKPSKSKGRVASQETREKLSKSHRGLKYPTICKEGHWNWKGGITGRNEAIRKSADYKNWRLDVFERDNYTCVMCGVRGKELHADHIIPFWKDESKRFDVSNGRTLCISCHMKTDTYGHRAVKNATLSEKST